MTHHAPLFEPVLETARPHLLPVAAFLAVLPVFVFIASLYVKALPSGMSGIAALVGWPLALFLTIQALPNGRSA